MHLDYELHELYSKHPLPNSIVFFCDVLKHYGVDNTVVNFSNENYKHVFDIKAPMLTFSNTNKGEFILIIDINPDMVSLIRFNKRLVKITTDEFIKDWPGSVVIPFEKTFSNNNKLNDKIYDTLFRASKYGLLAFCLLLFFFQFLNFSILNFLFLITTMIGTTISILIFLYEERSYNSLIHRICGDKDNCNEIIKSCASFVFGRLKWADVSIAYFASLIVVLLCFSKNSLYLLTIFPVLGVLTFIFTIYSLSYQFFIARKLCKFCLAILFVFTLQIITYLVFKPVHILPIDKTYFGIFCLIFILVILSWIYLNSYLKVIVQNSSSVAKLNQLKYNKDVFFTQLQSEQIDSSVLSDAISISIGDGTLNNFTFFINLECDGCKEIVKEITYWLKRPYENFTFNLVLHAGFNINSIRHQLSVHFVYTFLKKGIIVALDELLNYYDNPSNTILLKDKNAEKVINTHSEYVDKFNIDYSPVVFYNGYKLPTSYTFDDMKFIIDL